VTGERVEVVTPDQAEVIPVGPSQVVVLLGASQTGGRHTVVEERLPPASGVVPAHVHESMDHVFFVLEGTVRFSTGDEHHDVGVGGAVFVSRGVPHAFGNASETEPARFLELDSPGGFEDYFRELSSTLAKHGFDVDRIRELQLRYDTHPPG
jgi:quercetin dioxygenase-like cupin family protein